MFLEKGRGRSDDKGGERVDRGTKDSESEAVRDRGADGGDGLCRVKRAMYGGRASKRKWRHDY